MSQINLATGTGCPPPPPPPPPPPNPWRPTKLAGTVANADAYTSLVDGFIAAQIRKGWSPDHLDRNGRPLVGAL